MPETTTDNPSHLPPQNVESEEQVLGSLIMEPELFSLVDQLGLRETDFYRPSHRIVFEVARYLAERGTCDELAVINELKARRKLKSVGGAAAILTLVERVYAVATAKAHIEEVIDQSILRSMVETGHEIARLGYEHPDKIKKLVDRSVNLTEVMAKNSVRVLSDGSSAEALAEWTAEHLLGNTELAESFPYPLPKIQNSTGGYRRGQLVSFGAYPGVGKSAFRNQMVLALDPSVRVGILTLEMEAHQEQLRLISNVTGIDTRMLRTRTFSEEQAAEALDAAMELSQRKYDIHSGNKSIEQIVAIQKRYQYDVLVVDHFHSIDGSEETKTNQRIAQKLADLALSENCAVVNLFQLNRDREGGFPPPNVNRVKGGNAIFEKSAQMFFIHREYNAFDYPTNTGQIIFAKDRDGESGWSIPVTFNPSRVAFEEKKKHATDAA